MRMDQYRVEISTDSINRMFDNLNFENKDARKAVRAGLAHSGRIIRNEARSNLKNIVNSRSGRKLNSKNLVQFVKATVYKNSTGVRVDALPDKRSQTNRRLARQGLANKSFIVQFFEYGTAERKTKSHKRWGQGRRGIKRRGKGGYRGRIKEYKFFDKAVQLKQREAEKALQRNIINQINRIAKGKQ